MCIGVCQIELLLAPPGALFNCLMAVKAVAHNQHLCFLHSHVCIYIKVLVCANGDREISSGQWKPCANFTKDINQ